MTKRDVVRTVFEGRQPPYVPWHFLFSTDSAALLRAHLGVTDLERALDNHMLMLRRSRGAFRDLGDGRVQDIFGVVWDRNLDKDTGIVTGVVLPEPTLRDFSLPDPLDPRFYVNWDELIADGGDRFRVFSAATSLFERAWSLRGLENLMMDFYDNPAFVHELFDQLADFNIAQVKQALTYDIDCVYFGDDWGSQRGLLVSRRTWDEFIRPRVARMYKAVHDAGKFVMNHSCGDIDELFDDLITLGLNCTNPFQPEVMDVDDLMDRYRGRLTFMGGLSIQQTLPNGSPEDVRRESEHLLSKGRLGSYIFAPAHAVQGDAPLENILAFIDAARRQDGFRES